MPEFEYESHKETEEIEVDEPAHEIAGGQCEEYPYGEIAESQQEVNFGKAEELTEYLFTERENSSENYRRFSPEETGVFQADIELDMAKFSSLADLCLETDNLFPCVSLNGDLPIPVNFGFDFLWNQYGTVFSYSYIRELLSYGLREFKIENLFAENSKVESLYTHPIEAKGFFKEKIKKFLSVRFNAAGLFGPGAIAPVSPPADGLPFRVVTSTHGLRVHYSRACFLNKDLVFGSRTSPVDGIIRPGTHIFGVAGPGIEDVKFSPAEFDTPYATQADLLEL